MENTLNNPVCYHAHLRKSNAPTWEEALTAEDRQLLVELLCNPAFEVYTTPYGAKFLHRHELSEFSINEIRASDISPEQYEKLVLGRLELSTGVCRQLMALFESAISDATANRQDDLCHLNARVCHILNTLFHVLDQAAENELMLVLEPQLLPPMQHEVPCERSD